ncbi:ABC transporter ATP-binding protein/permease [Phyllobacterium sp. 21LDTY02-6]|uniref:ABC transporter ATP-binding protein n=1 Tax=Phyllobacterium sp. 21LDTY02-6 TaxID=2944903 RepID=UPI002020F901|nr:ABC transporter ATP-binding protein [Phyllobacterium sp. 21LDTY02-6]MCO4315804.1 ABC transporter ATP-binding protein/permease [Phyllobacterium sp. 21LDTY02-6]
MKYIFALFENWIDPYAAAPSQQVPTRTLAFMWSYVRQQKFVFLAMLICSGFIALFEASLFWFVGQLVDILAATDRAAGWNGLIETHGPTLLFMFLAIFVGRTLALSLAALVEEQAIVPGFNNLVRWQAHRVVSGQSLAFFQNDFAGRIVSKVWSTGQALGDFMITLLQAVWFSLIYCATTIGLVGQLDWRLGGVIVVWLGIFGLNARYFLPRIRQAAKETAETSSLATGQLVDGYSNIQTLKLFGTASRDDAYLKRGMDKWLEAVSTLTRGLTGIRMSLALTSGAMISVVAIVSIDLWLDAEISSGEVAFTLGLVLRLSMLLNRMMANLNGLLRNYGTVQNSMELLARPVKVTDRPGATELEVTSGEIEFANVDFNYGQGADVIRNFNLTIRAGEKVGLVGRSGVGKSTLVNLLLRFYDIDGGAIRIDGRNIADVTQNSLRRHIGVVTQDTSLLHRSIRDNIIYGKPDASEAELADAVRQAHADGFIAELVDQRGRRGFDAQVGERGVKLSGGQRQRIAIARVMLKNAPILVLDEATSALDSDVEAAIQESLYALMRGKTVIAIAHRLSTIAALDRLVVIDQGRIVEAGTHEELLAAGGIYAALWHRQSGGFIGNE